MPTAAAQLTEIAAQWRAARQVYSIYGAINKQHKLGPTCRELDSPLDRNDRNALEHAGKWLDEMDAKVEAFHVRQLLQTTQLGTDEVLRALIGRVLAHEPKDDRDRDKLDFLLVQYFAQCSPPAYHKRDVALDQVAEVLEPVLGECSTRLPDWMAPLETILDEMHQCAALADLLERRVLERGRQLKTEAGAMYFGSAVLLAFTRFNFHVRRTFFRLMQADIHGIRTALHKLDAKGIHAVDCSLAGLKSDEPTGELRKICHDWKTPFRAAYSMGQNFLTMVKVRAAVEAAVAAIPAEAPVAPVTPAVEESRASVAAPAAAEIAAPAKPEPEPETEAAPAPPVEAAPAAMEHVAPSGEPAAVEAPPVEQPVSKEISQTATSVEKEVAAASEPASDAALGPPAAAAQPAPAPAQASDDEIAVVVEPEPCDLQPVLEKIAEELISSSDRRGASVTTIHVGDTKLLLSSWEVAAFVQGGDDVSDVLQRAVAARALLFEHVDRWKKARSAPQAGTPDFAALTSVVRTADMESVAIADSVLQAKQAKNIDAAVNLAATGKRLLNLAQEAKKLLSDKKESTENVK